MTPGQRFPPPSPSEGRQRSPDAGLRLPQGNDPPAALASGPPAAAGQASVSRFEPRSLTMVRVPASALVRCRTVSSM